MTLSRKRKREPSYDSEHDSANDDYNYCKSPSPDIRHRSRHDSPDHSNDHITPLTEANLAALQSFMPPSKASDAKSTSFEAASQASTVIDLLLQTWDIRIDEGDISKTSGLYTLVNRIKHITDTTQITPKSQKVVDLQPIIKQQGELDTIKALERYLAPLSGFEEDGIDGLWRVSDKQWKQDVVPRPDTSQDTDLDIALEAVGSPAKPKPDLTFGYGQSIFTRREMAVLATLGASLVMPGQPYFPFLMYEWKSEKNGGNMHGAIRQAVRDGAAAVSSMCKFLERPGTASKAEPDTTAVFSVCVTSHLELRIHWRQRSGDTVSWESQVLHKAFLDDDKMIFKFRRILDNILSWAMGDRLNMIQASLANGLQRTNSRIRNLRQEPTPSHTASLADSALPSNSPARKRLRLQSSIADS